MNVKRVVLLVAVIVAVLLAGIATQTGTVFAGGPQNGPKKHLVHVKTHHNKKKIVHEDGTTGAIEALKGEIVTWKAEGSDVYFQFPDTSIFGIHYAFVKDSNELTLTVQPSAVPGTYPYAAFCIQDSSYAQGDSPPVIIIH